MSEVIIYHNPRCSKSRDTLHLLRDEGFEPTIVEYLKTPLDANAIKDILSKLGFSARELLRKSESAYQLCNLSDETLDDETIINAMVEHPTLIERPIVVHNQQAAIGRPPENVLKILEEA